MQIILFGQLTDITGNASIVLDDITDTDELVKTINELYPGMVDGKYVIAVDKKICHSNTALTKNSQVALLPPFSGG